MVSWKNVLALNLVSVALSGTRKTTQLLVQSCQFSEVTWTCGPSLSETGTEKFPVSSLFCSAFLTYQRHFYHKLLKSWPEPSLVSVYSSSFPLFSRPVPPQNTWTPELPPTEKSLFYSFEIVIKNLTLSKRFSQFLFHTIPPSPWCHQAPISCSSY